MYSILNEKCEPSLKAYLKHKKSIAEVKIGLFTMDFQYNLLYYKVLGVCLPIRCYLIRRFC